MGRFETEWLPRPRIAPLEGLRGRLSSWMLRAEVVECRLNPRHLLFAYVVARIVPEHRSGNDLENTRLLL